MLSNPHQHHALEGQLDGSLDVDGMTSCLQTRHLSHINSSCTTSLAGVMILSGNLVNNSTVKTSNIRASTVWPYGITMQAIPLPLL